MTNDAYTQPQPVRAHRSDPIFAAAFRLGLPMDFDADGESAMVHLTRQSLQRPFTPEEWKQCSAFKDACARGIQTTGKALLMVVLALFEANQINLGQLLEAIRRIDEWEWGRIRTECQCRPGEGLPESDQPSWKTPRVKSHLKGFTFSNAVVAAGFGVAIAVSKVPGAPAVLVRVAPVMGVLAAVNGLMAYVSNELASDPPDPNFAEVPTAVQLPRMSVDIAALPIALQTAFTDALDLAASQLSLSFALLTAIERSQGAELAGQTGARNLQLSAAADFAEQLAPVVEAQAPTRATLVAALRADGATTVIDTEAMVLEVLPAYLDGPPEEFVRAVAHYGTSNQDPNELWQRVGARLFDGDDLGAGVFPEKLNPPELALAEASAAETFRQLAALWRG